MEAVPRPAPDSRHAALAERWHRWRADPRIGVALLVCVAIAAGVAWFRAGVAPASPPASADAKASKRSTAAAASSTSTSTSTTTAVVVVDVVGAVRTPSVVTLPSGSRVVDAIDAAGGAAEGADLTRLNLAAVLGDGARVAVPMVGQPPPAIDPTAVSGASTRTGDVGAGVTTNDASAGASGLINVNTASAEQLEALPGVGPATAAAIVEERESNGPFTTIDDLDRVSGIGPAKLEQLRDHVSV
jgi:competence protein ComEA